MAIDATPEIYTKTVLLLGAGVIAAPIFKRIGLGTVLGYLVAGVLLASGEDDEDKTESAPAQ